VTHAWQKLPTDRLDIDFIERRRVALEVCNLLSLTTKLEYNEIFLFVHLLVCVYAE